METTRSQLSYSTRPHLQKLWRGRTKPIVSPDYIVSLTDGEGCFYALVRPPYNHKGGAIVQLNFFIKVREDDKEMLEKVRNTFQCGAVYFQHETRKNHTQCYRYTVLSHEDILKKIIPFFENHPLRSSSKKRVSKFSARSLDW